MSQGRLVTIERLRQLYTRIRLNANFDQLQVIALATAIAALQAPVTVDWRRRCVHHHPLIEVEEVV